MNEWNFFTFSLHFQFLSFTRIFHRFCLGSSSGSSFCLAIPLYHLHKVYLFTTSSSSLLFSSVSVNSFFMGLFHLLLLFYLIQPLLTISGQVSIVNNARHHRCLCVWELFVFKSSAMNPHRVRGEKKEICRRAKVCIFYTPNRNPYAPPIINIFGHHQQRWWWFDIFCAIRHRIRKQSPFSP